MIDPIGIVGSVVNAGLSIWNGVDIGKANKRITDNERRIEKLERHNNVMDVSVSCFAVVTLMTDLVSHYMTDAKIKNMRYDLDRLAYTCVSKADLSNQTAFLMNAFGHPNNYTSAPPSSPTTLPPIR